MDLNQLLHYLKHGDSYMVNDGINESHQVLRPPSKYGMLAAKVIEDFVGQLQRNQEYMNRLTHERDEYFQEVSNLRRSLQELQSATRNESAETTNSN